MRATRHISTSRSFPCLSGWVEEGRSSYARAFREKKFNTKDGREKEEKKGSGRTWALKYSPRSPHRKEAVHMYHGSTQYTRSFGRRVLGRTIWPSCLLMTPPPRPSRATLRFFVFRPTRCWRSKAPCGSLRAALPSNLFSYPKRSQPDNVHGGASWTVAGLITRAA